MADAAVIAGQSRSGQNNNAGDDRALFEKKMQTDVLRFFQSTNVAKELVTVKTIQNGKSAAFPVVGNASASYHEVGTELGNKKIASTEREITIDKILEAHTYVPDIDDAMVHYDANSAYNEAIGRALGKKYDQDLFRMIAKAAQINDAAAATAAGLLTFADDIFSQPVSFAAAGDELLGDKVYAKIVEAVSNWVDLDIVGEPVIVLKPESYYALLNNPANTGMTWVNDEASQTGKVPTVLGKRVLTSPHVPSADDSANASVLTKYQGDFTAIQGLMFSKEAVGALELMSLQLRSDYVPTRLSTLIVGKMLVGFGILNHSAAVAIKKFVTP